MKHARLAIAIATVWGALVVPHSAIGAMVQQPRPEIMGGSPPWHELADGIAATFEGRTLGDIASALAVQRKTHHKRCEASWVACYLMQRRPDSNVVYTKGAW